VTASRWFGRRLRILCPVPSEAARRARRRIGRRVRCVVGAAVLSAMTAACGGGSTSTSTATSASTSTEATATTVAPATTAPPTTTATKTTSLPAVAQDVAAAKRVLLQPADLPTYKAPSGEASPFVQVYPTCTKDQLMPGGTSSRRAGQGLFFLDETATVRALQTTGVSSFAVFADNEADARRAVADLAKPDVVECVGKALLADVRELTPGTNVTETSVPLPALTVGQETAGLRTTVAGTSSQYFDLTVVRKGRMLAYLWVSRLGKVPFPEVDRQRLTALLASRLT
jgi:hypothetical protein